MAWDPSLHPRWSDGRWRVAELAPGYYTLTDKRGRIHHYYLNDVNQLKGMQNVLTYGSFGRTTPNINNGTLERGNVPLGATMERTHLMATDDEELMAVSASDHGTTGVIYHDTDGPSDVISLDRCSQWEPHEKDKFDANGNAVNADDQMLVKGFGGPADNMTLRYDDTTYDTLNAKKAEEINRRAFEAPDAKVYEIDPAEFAEKAVEARREYQDVVLPNGKHVSESQARNMPVHVYVDKKGEVQVKPARRYDEKNQTWVERHAPNTHGGSPSCRLQLSDVTRSCRALQADHVTSAQFAISSGTNTTKKGLAKNNALHFRADYDTEDGHHPVTAWGTVEQRNEDNTNHGVSKEKAKPRFQKPDGTFDNEAYKASRKRSSERRARMAKEYYGNPKTPDGAKDLLEMRYGEGRYTGHKLEVNGNTVLDRSNPDITAVYSASDGSKMGFRANTAKGLGRMYSQAHPELDPKDVSVSEIKNGDATYYAVRRPRTVKGDRQWVTEYYTPEGRSHAREWKDEANPGVVNYFDGGRVAQRKATD